ncbi:MAG: regulatory protein RecX [Dongiaceae bacterium]
MTKLRTLPENSKSAKPKIRKARKITPDYLHNASLYYLGRFSASTGSLRRVLIRRVDKAVKEGISERESAIKMVEDLLAQFNRAGLLNDKLYAQGLTRSLRRKGASKKQIQAKLYQKQIDRNLIRASLETEEGRDELSAAKKLAQKRKWGPYRGRSDQEADRKDLARLARAGFSYDICRQIISLKEDDA